MWWKKKKKNFLIFDTVKINSDEMMVIIYNTAFSMGMKQILDLTKHVLRMIRKKHSKHSSNNIKSEDVPENILEQMLFNFLHANDPLHVTVTWSWTV